MRVPEEDAALVTRCQRGGAAGQLAFESLVARHQQWLVRFVLHLLGNQTDAEDVAQDTFVRAFLAISECTDGSRFRGWIRVIARRLAFNQRRNERTRKRYEGETMVARPEHAQPHGARLEGRDALEHALRRVSYAYREIMVLRYVEELPMREIAEVLELGASAAKMRLLRARNEFQAAYKAGETEHGTDPRDA